MKKFILFLLMISASFTFVSCTDNPVRPSEEAIAADVQAAALALDHLAAAARFYRYSYSENPRSISALRVFMSDRYPGLWLDIASGEPNQRGVDELWTFSLGIVDERMETIQCESTPQNPLGRGEMITLNMRTGDYHGEAMDYVSPEFYQNLIWRFYDFRRWEIPCLGETQEDRVAYGKTMRHVNMAAVALKEFNDAYSMYWQDYSEAPVSADELIELEYVWLDEPVMYYWNFSLFVENERHIGFMARPSEASNLADNMILTVDRVGSQYISNFDGPAAEMLNPWLMSLLYGRLE